MSDAILEKLDELKDEIRGDIKTLRSEVQALSVDLHQAIRQSNESVLNAIQALQSATQDCRSRVAELERIAS